MNQMRIETPLKGKESARFRADEGPRRPPPTANQSPGSSRSARAADVLHWTIMALTAAALAAGWLGKIGTFSPEQANRIADLHSGLGTGLAALVVLLVAWRIAIPGSQAELPRPVWVASGIWLLAGAIYLLLLAMLASGVFAQPAGIEITPPPGR